MQVIVNGKMIDRQSAVVSLSDRGLLLADGLFETMRVSKGEIHLFDFHWKRMVSSLKKLYIPLPFLKDQLSKEIYLLINSQNSQQRRWSVRLTITRGEGGRGIGFSSELKPNYFITVAPWSPPNQDINIVITSSQRNENSPITQIKSLNYLDNVLARHEANQRGFDDAIFLNSKGFLTESTIANLFVVQNNIICTPPISDGLLPGITREVILKNALKKNIPIKECSISLSDLKHGSEVFLTNTLIGIQRVASIENYFSAGDRKCFDLISMLYSQLIK
jgi:branched-chain amino acid aminotransferase